MKIILSIILCAVASYAQSKTNGQIAVAGATIDHREAITRPFRSVTTLPATCGVGDMVNKTNATAGQNLYACTSTNTWTLQSGGATGLAAALVSNTLTITCPSGKCDLYKGDTRTSVSALSFVVTPLAGTYTAYIYYEGGTVKFGAATGATFTTCTGTGVACVTGITAFPAGVIPLFTASVSSGVLQAGSVVDVSPNFFAGKTPVAGTNVSITETATDFTINSTGGSGGGGAPLCTSTTNAAALVGTCAPVKTALTLGDTIEFKSTTYSNTGAVTLNVDGLGVKNIYVYGTAAINPSPGHIFAGVQIKLTYDGTNFRLPPMTQSSGLIQKGRGNGGGQDAFAGIDYGAAPTNLEPWTLREDFNNLGPFVATAGTVACGTAASPFGGDGYFGTARMTTSVTLNSMCGLYFSSGANYGPVINPSTNNTYTLWDHVFRIRTDATSIADTFILAGFVNSTPVSSATAVQGTVLTARVNTVATFTCTAGIDASAGNAALTVMPIGGWYFAMYNAGNTYCIYTGVIAAANTAYKFRFRSVTPGTVEFYMGTGGVAMALVGTSSTSIPTTTAALFPSFGISNMTGGAGTARNLDVDFYGGVILGFGRIN